MAAKGKQTVEINTAEARRLARQFDGLGGDVQKDVNREVGLITGRMVQRIRARVPSKSGRARASVRAKGGKITAGGPGAPHYPWLEFGGSTKVPGAGRRVRRDFVKTGRYIFPTISEGKAKDLEAVEKAVARVAEKHGLDTR
jgi:hypothetical protein